MDKRNIIGGAILIIGAVFIAIGVGTGEFLTVMQKATIICLECIGIG